MATQRPTLKEIIERVEQDMISRLGTVPPRLSLMRTLARAEAGVAHGLYGYIDTKEKNFLPDTGDEETVLRWASLFKVTRLSAVAAAGTVQATGTNGSVIPAGRELQNTSTGVRYTVDADATIASGVASVSITAVDRGTGGNVDTGATLSFVSPVTGVLSSVTVQSPGIAGGAELETIEALRVRVLDRLRAPPRGGTSADYVAWAKEAHPSVTRVWPSAGEMSANSVTVRFVTDDAAGGIIPDSEVIAAVDEYIDEHRPITAELYVAAPTAVDLDLEIDISPDTQAVKDAITAELQDMIKREAEPGGTILLSRINEAISNAAGEADHVLVSPSANVTHTTGQIAVLGTITWGAL